MLTGIFVLIALSLLIIGHEAGHFVAAKLFGLKVDEFGFGFPPRLFARKRGETEYSFNWLPFGGFVKIAGENDTLSEHPQAFHDMPETERKRYFTFQPAWRRAVVILAGITVNVFIGFVLMVAVFMVGTAQVLVVTGTQEKSPAAAAGFLAGDVLADFKTSQDFIAFVNAHRAKSIDIHIVRNGSSMLLHATPRQLTQEGEGALGVFLADGGFAPQGFRAALTLSARQVGSIAYGTLLGFGQLLTSLFIHAKLPAGIVGPVGIVSVAAGAGKIGFTYVLQLISLISINLAVLNLIPFPALDGGRFFLILVEKIKGSPISFRTERLINGIGFIFLIALMLLITVRDVSRLF